MFTQLPSSLHIPAMHSCFCVPAHTPPRMCPSHNHVSLFHDRNIIFRWLQVTPIMLHSATSGPQSHIPILFTTGQISTNCTVQFSHWDFTHKFLLLETNLGKYCVHLSGQWWIRQSQRKFWLCHDAVVLFAFRFRQLLSKDLWVPFAATNTDSWKSPLNNGELSVTGKTEAAIQD